MTSCGTVLWRCPGLPLTTTGKRNMYWALKLQEDRAAAEETYSLHLVTDGTEDEGGHALDMCSTCAALDMFLAPPHAVFDDVFAELEASGLRGESTQTLRHQMLLRLRPEHLYIYISIYLYIYTSASAAPATSSSCGSTFCLSEVQKESRR